MQIAKRSRRLAATALIALAAIGGSVLGPAPAAAAAGAAWSHLLQGQGILSDAVVAADGSLHAITYSNDCFSCGTYITDRGGSIHTQTLPVHLWRVLMDPSDHPVVLGIGDGGQLILYEDDGTGALVGSDLPGAASGRADLAITDDGTIHVAWGYQDDVAHYASRTASGWTSPVTLAPAGMLTVESIALAVDGSGTPHVLVGAPMDGPGGCVAQQCIADVTVSALPTLTLITTPSGFMRATTDAVGSVDAVVTAMGAINHLTNSTGSWVVDQISGAGSSPPRSSPDRPASSFSTRPARRASCGPTLRLVRGRSRTPLPRMPAPPSAAWTDRTGPTSPIPPSLQAATHSRRPSTRSFPMTSNRPPGLLA